MPRPRLSDAEKLLRGTYEQGHGEHTQIRGRVAVLEPLPPPDDLDKAARQQWAVHCHLLVARRILSISDLPALRALSEVAAAREKAYKAAMRAGPVTRTAEGAERQSAAWGAFIAADQAYLRWTAVFGLSPRWAASATPLPPPGPGRLQAVE